MCLHLVSRASFESPSLAQCLAVYAPEDALLLLGDAVYSRFDSHLRLPASVFALTDDWQLRLKNETPPANIHLIDYPQWVDLAVAHAQSVTWA